MKKYLISVVILLGIIFIACSNNNPDEPEKKVDDERIFGTWYRCFPARFYHIVIYHTDFKHEWIYGRALLDGSDSIITHEIGTFELKDSILYYSTPTYPSDSSKIILGTDEKGDFIAFPNACDMYTYRRNKCY